MSVLQKLTEGVVQRNVETEGAALLTKWEATGLLEGLNAGQHKQGMAVLLENQAKELLREASAMAAGDVEGFAAVAFPIVRRVFGGLIANDLVSVQPMSLPSGLIFFLDFTRSADARGDGKSVYGGNVVGEQLTGGVDLGAVANGLDAGGFYDFNTGLSHATASLGVGADSITDAGLENKGSLLEANSLSVARMIPAGTSLVSALTEADKKLIDFDPDVLANSTARIMAIDIPLANFEGLNRDALAAIDLHPKNADGTRAAIQFMDSSAGGNEAPGALSAAPATTQQVRRLTSIVTHDSQDWVRFILVGSATLVTATLSAGVQGTGDHLIVQSYPVKDEIGNVSRTGLIGAVAGAQTAQGWELEGRSEMAEIDIKVDSVAVTAQTKKLKAKWTPELGQDLNAYHNLDAEVELTGILSEQIALEIDRELLGDLVQGATAGTRHWSRAPGLFVNADGSELGATSAAPDFTGTVSEWYETLIETINDVSAQIHRKTLRGGANFVVCSPEVANILEFTSGFRASVTADQDRGTIGAVKSGSLSKKFDVYVDPYFLRNVVLVGRKGSSFLESGFVYSPYIPLQVTPTIFGPDDFVPRKGVMTRYAKKMVRPDMYGLVIVRGLLGEAGAS